MPKINTVLVANRGEIAIRVFRACNELGIRTVAIYSKEDTLSLHRNKADEAYMVGEGKSPTDAYLDIEDILRVAKEHDVDAIHPGYGFLSENSNLARRCAEEGLIFIGPRLEHLVMFGDKINARKQAELAGIPMIPGSKGTVNSLDEVLAFGEKCGYPIIIKAVNGGGGRGMRIVNSEEEMAKEFKEAIDESKKAIAELKDKGVWVFGTAAEGSIPMYKADLTVPAAIVIGNEGEGLSQLVRKNCDVMVSIPMKGKISSLNASAAASILLYEAVRQRIG